MIPNNFVWVPAKTVQNRKKYADFIMGELEKMPAAAQNLIYSTAARLVVGDHMPEIIALMTAYTKCFTYTEGGMICH